MKTLLLRFVLWSYTIGSTVCASTGADTQSIASPDGNFIAEISSSKAQFTEDTVKISATSSTLRAEFPLTSKNGSNGRNVLKAEWSPDSKFFVFSTFSSGGHSSWNFQTFAYSIDANKFASLDEEVRPVTNKDFELIAPHTLQIETLNPAGIDFPSFKRIIDLATLFQ